MQHKRRLYTLGSTTSHQISFPSLIAVITQKEGSQPEQQILKNCQQQGLSMNLSLSSKNSIASAYNQLFPTKYKFIKKPAKGKEIAKEQRRKEKQQIRYKFMERKIYQIKNTSQIDEHQVGTFDLKKIVDWQMEAAHTLYLSKNAFYSAFAMSKIVFEKQINRNASAHTLQMQAASIVCLAAKMENANINFTAALEMICGFLREDLIAGEVYVLKELKYRISSVSVYSEILSVCHSWQLFVASNSSLLKIDTEVLKLGDEQQVCQWEVSQQQKMEDIFHFFDQIMMKQAQKYCASNPEHVKIVATFSLFIVMSHRARQKFPSNSEERTYLVMVFQNFLHSKFEYDLNQFSSWIAKLVQLNEDTSVTKDSQKYWGSPNIYESSKEDIQTRVNMSDDCVQPKVKDESYFYLQKYKNFLE